MRRITESLLYIIVHLCGHGWDRRRCSRPVASQAPLRKHPSIKVGHYKFGRLINGPWAKAHELSPCRIITKPLRCERPRHVNETSLPRHRRSRVLDKLILRWILLPNNLLTSCMRHTLVNVGAQSPACFCIQACSSSSATLEPSFSHNSSKRKPSLKGCAGVLLPGHRKSCVGSHSACDADKFGRNDLTCKHKKPVAAGCFNALRVRFRHL